MPLLVLKYFERVFKFELTTVQFQHVSGTSMGRMGSAIFLAEPILEGGKEGRCIIVFSHPDIL